MLLGKMSLAPVSEAAIVKASVPMFWEQLSRNAPAIGSAWILSSVIYTTYSTTSWLKCQLVFSSTLTRKNHILSRFNGVGSPIKRQGFAESPIMQQLLSDRPALLTLYRFGGSLLLGLLLPNPLNFASKWEQTMRLLPSFLQPALFLFGANYFNSISLNLLGIPLTYTTKCGIPIFTVLISILVNGPSAIPKLSVWLSLIPIVIGIAAASYNAESWNMSGFLFALFSCISQSALNVVSKKALNEICVSGVEAQRVMVSAALVFMTTLSLFKTGLSNFGQNEKVKDGSFENNSSNNILHHPPLILTLMAITAYHFEYVLSFMYVSLTEPITYALCDAMRRLGMILSGKIMFGGEKLSTINKTGIGLAICGALLYAINK